MSLRTRPGQGLALAVTCHDPRGSFAAGIQTAAAVLRTVVGSVAVNATEETSPTTVGALETAFPRVVMERHAAGSIGIGTARLRALALALRTDCTHVLYSDVDHLLRWATIAPDDLAAGVESAASSAAAMVVIGRSEASLEAEPRRLQLTEGAVNQLVSLVLGVDPAWDFMIAIRLMRRETAELLVEHCAEPSIANDVVWPLHVHAAGLPLSYATARGLAYRYRDEYGAAADQRDRLPDEWIRRIQIAAQHAGAVRPYL